MLQTYKPILVKSFRILLKVILGFIAFILFYLLCAFVLSNISVNSEQVDNGKTIPIYVKSNGVHTDIVLPTITDQYNWFENVSHFDKVANKESFKYIALGWGDKGFYLNTPTWADLSASTAFNAAFGLSGTTAMHATFRKSIKEKDSCKKVLISRAQHQLLIDYITGTFQVGADSRFIKIETDANYGKTDAFYEAHGTYSLFKTCNTWANRGLKKSDLPAAYWTAFPKGILSKY